MNLKIIISIIFIIAFLVTAVYIFISMTRVSDSLTAPKPENKFKRYFPAIISGFLLLLIIVFTIFSDINEDKQKQQVKELSADMAIIAKTNEAEPVDRAVDAGKLEKLGEKIDHQYKTAVELKKNVNESDGFGEPDPELKDSVDSVYNNLLEKKHTLSRIEAYSKGSQKHGYAYYGIYNGTWTQQNFSAAKMGLPETGASVKCLVPTNVREGVIEYIEGKGWVNKPLIGGLAAGEEVKVLEVIKVQRNFIWIRF